MAFSPQKSERILAVLAAVARAAAHPPVTAVDIAYELGRAGRIDLLNNIRERTTTEARAAGLLAYKSGTWALTAAGEAALAAGQLEQQP
jgi:hypothetical protein